MNFELDYVNSLKIINYKQYLKRSTYKMSDDGSKKDDSDHEEEEMGLTKEEQDKCWEAFSAFDKDGSGFIDANELKIVLEMMGQKTTEEEIYRMIAEADAENTGRITYA